MPGKGLVGKKFGAGFDDSERNVPAAVRPRKSEAADVGGVTEASRIVNFIKLTGSGRATTS
jgi:hypothetical protein